MKVSAGAVACFAFAGCVASFAVADARQTPMPMPAASAPMAMPMPAESPAALPSPAPMTMPGPAASVMPMRMQMGAGHAMTMSGMLDPAVPPAQEGSGTSWLPASSEQFATMRTGRDGAMTMLHYAAFPRFVQAGSARGEQRFDAPNWLMLMRSQPLGTRANLSVSSMFSLEPLTENQSGYPDLYQSGEAAYGAPLHDRQHPHDLVSELALAYAVRTGTSGSAYLYIGYPGEPALGPPAFMHRRIGYDAPSSPIGHHWEDSTHVTFGVATLGAGTRTFKLEASTFTGREPDEIRTNFDPVHLDSGSARISWNPTRNLATQVSYGYVHSPEALDPGVSLHRTTASAFADVPLGGERNLWYGAVWGRNTETTRGAAPSDAYLIEADYRNRRDTLYARAEQVRKSATELVLPSFAGDPLFDVGAYTVGYVRDVTTRARAAHLGVGAELTLGPKPASLDPYYGAGTPASFQIFLRIRPPAMRDGMTENR